MTFANLGLSLPILQAITEQGYKQPSPIQAEAIPAVLAGQDVMAAAQTGTGKTAGFTLPILELLSRGERARPNQVRALVLTPTRELAAQVAESVATYGRHLPIRSSVVFGGVKINPQMMNLRRGADILVATPGRLLDLYNQNAVKFKHLEGKGILAAAIHGNKSQGARTRALADFKNNDITALVATDIAARGLDIDQLPQVVNFDLPNVPEDYVHRIGRTGRAGADGHAVSLVCADESKQLRDIERLINQQLPREMISGFEPVNEVPVTQLSGKPPKPKKPKKSRTSHRPGQESGGNDKAPKQQAGQSNERRKSGGMESGRVFAENHRRPRRRKVTNPQSTSASV